MRHVFFPAKPPPPEQSDAESPVIRTQPPSLSLYVASVMLEYAHADYEICSSMFAGIKCQEDRGGERGARADWVWEYWQNDWVYREDSEVWGMSSNNFIRRISIYTSEDAFQNVRCRLYQRCLKIPG